MKWHRRFINLAKEVATWSKDTSTQVGALIVRPDRTPVTFAYNGFPRGIDDNIESRHERPAKYTYVVHAEDNAIANAARVGSALLGTTIYVTHFPCSQCARKIIQAGISTVVIPQFETADYLSRWGEECQHSKQLFTEAGVTIIIVLGDLDGT